MDVKAYFEQEHTPGENSPVGALMVRVLAKNPGMTFERARQEAHALLDRAARGRVYRVPTVYSAEEQAERKAKMFAVFSRPKASQEAA
jgi:hypothetical protein